MDLKVVDVIGSQVALSPEPGYKLYKEIRDKIRQRENVVLDFIEVKILSTAFLNSAIGRLYSDFNSDQLNDSLRIVNLADEDMSLLIRVIKRAKEYFKDKDSFDKKMEDRYE
ncbi:STAS-like domain-containing protein [Sphingobacterium sp.]|uniref:STAS-like domain-containing protein n=1 Tax=Sphingobacterium sp. TaxID=341027 RepID=UPI00289BB568|nr:STAS-like domain-containing protein [Sphingobacterium sp.]